MEKRVLLAVFLSFLVLYAYQALFIPRTAPDQRPSRGQPPATAAPDATPPAPATVGQPTPSTAPPPPAAPGVAAPAALLGDSAEREITVETQKVRAVFTNRGGRLIHWMLKQYKDDADKPLDLIPQGVAWFPKPFSLRLPDAALTARANGALYRTSTGATVDARRERVTLRFDFEDEGGLEVHKTFTIEPDSYVITFGATVSHQGATLNPGVTWGPGLGDMTAAAASGGFFSGSYTRPPDAFRYEEGKVQRVPQNKLSGTEVHQGDYRFAGIDDLYFVASSLRMGPQRILYDPVVVPAPDGGALHLVAATFEFRRGTGEVRYYFGPKDFNILKGIDPEFVRVIDFGFFAFLAVPLLGALQWVHGYVGNYGWSIIILTVLINVVMFPLRHKSVVSMRKMQELQPQLKAVQDRYANLSMTDPARQKMNQEIMELYKSRGVNPASGCLPMLLTLPVLFAFYALLSQAIELRGAGFGLWITDLSRHDPLYITPLMMGATMFWQQWITPTSMDPVQQKMMMIMPIMFSFMFLWAPSGLVLYWFVSNLWAIGQQYFTNWLIGPPQVRVARPAAERRVKSAGSGKSSGAR